jgi:hypothetical protein
VSKTIGVPLAKLAAKIMTGETLRRLGFTEEIIPEHFSVKEAVFPFLRYQGADIALGPEMKSTGEVMGIDVEPRSRVREIPDGGATFAARGRQRLHQCERCRQGAGDPNRP